MKKLWLISLMAMSFLGCATSVRYTSYTDQRLTVKPKDYLVTIYPRSVRLPAVQPYRVIGKVEVKGYASDGVTPEELMERARTVARGKGADAIINAVTQERSYGGMYVERGYWRYHHYHPQRYIPYRNTLLWFNGDLIVYDPVPITN